MGVQRDDVAVADQAQRTARSRLGADVQNTRAVGGSAHPGIGNPHHVGDALAQQLAGDGQLAPFGHAGGTARAGIAQHQHGIRGDIQVGVVEAGHHVAHVVEHHGGPLVHQQGRGGRAALDHCAAGRQVAAHHGQALRRLERGIDGGDDLCGGGDAGGQVVGDGLAADGQRVGVQQGLDGLHHRGDAAGVEHLLHQVLPGGPHVHHQRCARGQFVEPVQGKRHPGAAGDGQKVHDRVGGPADRQHQSDGIVEGLGSEHVRGTHSLGGQAHRTRTHLLGHLQLAFCSCSTSSLRCLTARS